MPLHLLGKKSWNVYNQTNIDRVRRDEADAAAREAAEEQAMQEADAERRMALLRGEVMPDALIEKATSPSPSPTTKDKELGRDTTYHERDRKRKRHHGEDDTERDLRYARHLTKDSSSRRDRNALRLRKVADDEALIDHAGHIDLFPAERRKAQVKGSKMDADGQANEAKKHCKLEDQVTMRFSNAAGYGKGTDEKPWYYSGSTGGGMAEDSKQVGKDLWGNEDPKRKEREKARLAAGDPLAAIMTGVKQVRRVEAERKKWREERGAELRVMREEEGRREQRRIRQKDFDHYQDAICEGRLDNFALDTTRIEDNEPRNNVEASHRRYRSHHKGARGDPEIRGHALAKH